MAGCSDARIVRSGYVMINFCGWNTFLTVRLLHIFSKAADLGDAGGVVVRAADEAEAVGQQRQGVHLAYVVREGAQDGAVVDDEELDSPVLHKATAAGERVLVVGPQSRVGYLLSRWRGPATPPTYLPSEAVKIYMYVGLVA